MKSSSLLFALASQVAITSGGAQETTRLELQLDRGYYRELAENAVYLKATLRTGGASEDSARPKLNVAFAVDRSGSMEGEKLANTKAAIRQVLSQLSSRDFFTLVAYNSEVDLPIPASPADKLAEIEPAIEGLIAEGGTSLFEGLSRAAAELRRHAGPETIDRVILITDGHPTKGPCEPSDFAGLAAEFAAEGISISAIGLGDDYPEETLYQLASAAGGTFRSARDPSQLVQIAGDEVSRLNTAIAKDATLEISFDGQIEIEEILGRPAEIERRTVQIRFDHLYANQELSVVARARLPASQSVSKRPRIARANLVYTPIDSVRGALPKVELESVATARFTSSSRVSYRSIDSAVLRTVCSFEIASSIREAFADFDQGKDRRALAGLRETARDVRSVMSNFEDLKIEDQLEELNRAIREIETRGIDSIDRKALTSTLFHRTHRGVPLNDPPPTASP